MAAERFFLRSREDGQTKDVSSDTWSFQGLRVSPGRLYNPSSLHDLFRLDYLFTFPINLFTWGVLIAVHTN